MTCTLTDTQWTLARITATGETLYWDEPILRTLLADARILHATVPLDRIEVTTENEQTAYLILLRDGRRWRQQFLDHTGNPPMTFTHNDAWRKTEFSLHRPIRDRIVDLVATRGVTNITLRPV